MISLDYFHNIKGLKCKFLEYETIRKKNTGMEIPVYDYSRERPLIPIMLEKISKGIQRNSDNVIIDVMQKWEEVLNVDISIQKLTKSFYYVQKILKDV